MKIINAEHLTANRNVRISSGIYITFLSSENVTMNDFFLIKFQDKVYYFEAFNITIEYTDLKVEAKETGYWASKLDRTNDLDLRTLLNVEVVKIEDPEKIKQIKTSSQYC